jgi:hypothetical protein
MLSRIAIHQPGRNEQFHRSTIQLAGSRWNQRFRPLHFLAKFCAWSVGFFCQGSPLRCDERKPRGLDSADGQAPSPAMKAFAFGCATFRRASEEQKQNPVKEKWLMQRITNKPLFDLGRLVATAGALAALEKMGQHAVEFLARHVTGDWGELPVEDRAENCLRLQHGFRLLGSYRTAAGDKLWVITEADRSATTLLLPDEYWFTDNKEKKEKNIMSTATAVKPSEVVPQAASRVQDIPLSRIHESKTNPRGRNAVDKANKRLYGKRVAFHFRDSQAPKSEEVKIAVCNWLKKNEKLAPRARFELATLRLTATNST